LVRIAGLRSAGFTCFLFAFAAACGGSVLSQKGDGDGGSTTAGGSSSQSGSASAGGKPSAGGSGAAGGSVGKAGSSSSAGTASVGGGPSCGDVMCQPVMGCPAGYALGQPAGACCQGCVPEPGGAMCTEQACPRSLCPLGYVRGDLVGGCCSECVPDALFCNDDSECVVADRPRSCCGCPEIMNVRGYNADPCWSSIAEPRPIPKSCYPQVVCDAICGPCSAPPHVLCQNHRCRDIGLK
jgi:hypothetical protein